MMQKPLLKIILGLIVSTAIMAFLFYFFIFLNPLGIYESNTLKWIPVFICMAGFYPGGLINRKTPVFYLFAFALLLLIFKLFNFTYFPFIIVLIAVGSLTLLLTRNSQRSYKVLSLTGLTAIFCYFLFAQPLVLLSQGEKYDENGALVGARVLWNFEKEKDLVLPNHTLFDEKDHSFNLSQVKGKVHLISFWATWCAPCMASKPNIEKLKQDLQHKSEIGFIDISFDDSPELWLKYLTEQKPAGIQLYAKSQNRTSRLLQFRGLPMYLVVDERGRYTRYRSFSLAEKAVRATISKDLN